jgi:hypothetical protein
MNEQKEDNKKIVHTADNRKSPVSVVDIDKQKGLQKEL